MGAKGVLSCSSTSESLGFQSPSNLSCKQNLRKHCLCPVKGLMDDLYLTPEA